MRKKVSSWWFVVAFVSVTPTWAQIKSPAERLNELESRIQELEDQVAEMEEAPPEAREASRARSLLTRLGERFTLGGKAEFLFIDSETERDAVIGSTDNGDPRFAIDVFRLEPRLEFNKEITMVGQIDFKPERSKVVLKELTTRHRFRPVEWLRSDSRLGLDDRFIRMQRRTENYPLIGNAFWRDESLAFWQTLRIGDKDGWPNGSSENEDREAFDFTRNPGELTFYFSAGNGYTLDGNEVGFDRADFNDLVQDDRDVSDDLSIREIGVGIGYRRNFQALGELGVMGFYYDDELNSKSIDYLQDELTVRDVPGNAVAGYGDSNSDRKDLIGASIEYFLPAEVLYGDVLKTRTRDGLRVAAQWIEGNDGKLRREGWFVQGSYRFSFPERLIGGRYFRSIEPLVRYGELNTNVSPDPTLPGTWDREEIVVGFLSEVTGNITFKLEYAFHDEDTGGPGASGAPRDADNNELSLLLMLEF